MALGADWCNSARGFMFALGCLQSQTCHTGACPTGVATQDPQRQKALVVPDKTERVYRFHENTLKALKELVQAAGLTHPNEISAYHIVRRAADHEVRLLANAAALRAARRAAGGRRKVRANGRTTCSACTGRWPAPTASPPSCRWAGRPARRRCRTGG